MTSVTRKRNGLWVVQQHSKIILITEIENCIDLPLTYLFFKKNCCQFNRVCLFVCLLVKPIVFLFGFVCCLKLEGKFVC